MALLALNSKMLGTDCIIWRKWKSTFAWLLAALMGEIISNAISTRAYTSTHYFVAERFACLWAVGGMAPFAARRVTV